MSAHRQPPFETEKGNRKKRWIVFFLKLAVLAGIYKYLFAKSDAAYVLDHFLNLDAFWFFVSLATVFLMYFIAAVRWQKVIQALGEDLDLRNAFRIFLVGMFFSQFLFASIGGDAVRIWLASRQHLRFRVSFNSTFFDRLAGLISVALFMSLSIPLYGQVISDQRALTSLFLLILMVMAGMLIVLNLDKISFISRLHSFQASFGKVAVDARKVFLRLGGGLPVIGYSILVLALTCLAGYALGRALGQTLPVISYLMMIPPVILISILPISLGGWGVREGAMVVAFGFLGMKGEVALMLSIWFGIVLLLVALPGGFLWLMAKERKVNASKFIS